MPCPKPSNETTVKALKCRLVQGRAASALSMNASTPTMNTNMPSVHRPDAKSSGNVAKSLGVAMVNIIGSAEAARATQLQNQIGSRMM